MSILSKVTLGFVAIMALVFTYLAMRTLKTHQAWRTGYNNHMAAVEASKAKLEAMIDGDPEKGTMSIGKLQSRLDSAMFGRGRAWMDSRPQFDRATGNVVVQVEQPQPHQIEPNSVLHAFQDLDDPAGGQYIAEFKVTAVDGNNVTMAPVYKQTGSRLQRLQGARGPWTLYEVLPTDMNDLFAGRADQEIQPLLPEPPQQLAGEADDDFQARKTKHQRLVNEYLLDNKAIKPENAPDEQRMPEMHTQVVVKFVKDQADLTEAAKNDLRAMAFGENLVKSGIVMQVDLKTAEELVRLGLVQEVERRYQRKLRDYNYVLSEFHRRLPVVEDRIANLAEDLDYLNKANDEAKLHLEEATKAEVVLKQELALVSKERDVVVQFHGTLQQRLDKLNTEIARLQAENQRLAAQLAQRQLEAVAGESRADGLESRARLLKRPAPILDSRL